MMKTTMIAAVLIVGQITLCGQVTNFVTNTVPRPPDLQKAYQKLNEIPPRYQWEHNGGYCGEVSLISAGLYYGQYLSQYDVRAIASPGMAQNAQEKGTYTAQLMLGSNDKSAANALRLTHERFDTDDSKDLLIWIKSHVVKGHPVFMGVFNNEYKLYNNKKPGAGDPEYDHIVPVVGWGSDYPLDDGRLHDDDVILISDNGLSTPYNTITPPIPPKGKVPYYFYYKLDHFLKDRAEANLPNGSMYSLLHLPKYQAGEDEKMRKDKQNYGLAITGVEDEWHETLPMRVSTSANYEAPIIGSDSDARPASMPISLAVQVSGLDASKRYHVYHYADENDVPRKHFNSKQKPWTVIRGTSGVWTTNVTIHSKQKAFFRAVEAPDGDNEQSEIPAETPGQGDKGPSDASSLF